MNLPAVFFSGMLLMLLFVDTCSTKQENKQALIQDIKQEIKELEEVEAMLSPKDAAKLLELSEQFNLESIQADMADLEELQEKLQLLKPAVKPYEDEDTHQADLLADFNFTVIPESKTTSESENKEIVSEAEESASTGKIIENETVNNTDKYKQGHVPDLVIEDMQCTLTMLIEKYDLIMVIEDDNNNYYLHHPGDNSFLPLTKEALKQLNISNRGFRRYQSEEAAMWKQQTEVRFGPIKSLGYAYPQKSEAQLVSSQFSYLELLNLNPEEIAVTYGYYNSDGELILTKFK